MNLSEFLVEAKINTYASNGEGVESNLDDGSHELIWRNGIWKYRDRYLGFNPFLGEEVVWYQDKITWGMNYYGKVTSNEVNINEVYGFLKKALGQVVTERPFRGPAEFREGDWYYVNKNSGSIDDFSGLEEICLGNQKIYELDYRGGLLLGNEGIRI